MKKYITHLTSIILLLLIVTSCKEAPTEVKASTVEPETPEYFLLRPEVEKSYGYSHAVRIGDDLKISGAVSMDEKGNLTAAGNMDQQMKNCYSDLEKFYNITVTLLTTLWWKTCSPPTWLTSSTYHRIAIRFIRSNSRQELGSKLKDLHYQDS